MEFADTHTHLFTEEFAADKAFVIERALGAGVKSILLPNIDAGSIDDLKAFAAISPEHCYPMMGLHPCSVKEDYNEQLETVRRELFSSYRYYGVGEIGMDLYWDKSTLEMQKAALLQQCGWAVELDIPVSLHTRDAVGETIACLKSMDNRPKGVFHCFTGSAAEAEEIISLGYYLGIGGVVTFKNSHLPQVLREVPLEYIVLETDSPYLAPVPYRGKRNESAYIPHIAAKLAEIYSVSIESVAATTTATAKSVFNL